MGRPAALGQCCDKVCHWRHGQRKQDFLVMFPP
jgi:hypothetical protein